MFRNRMSNLWVVASRLTKGSQLNTGENAECKLTVWWTKTPRVPNCNNLGLTGRVTLKSLHQPVEAVVSLNAAMAVLVRNQFEDAKLVRYSCNPETRNIMYQRFELRVPINSRIHSPSFSRKMRKLKTASRTPSFKRVSRTMNG